MYIFPRLLKRNILGGPVDDYFFKDNTTTLFLAFFSLCIHPLNLEYLAFILRPNNQHTVYLYPLQLCKGGIDTFRQCSNTFRFI